jgi:hypothetical protein
LTLPDLQSDHLKATVAHLRDVALVLGKFQQVFLPASDHDWQYGLIVVAEGLATQPFEVGGQRLQALLDMRAGEVRIGEARWPLAEYSAEELYDNFRVWLEVNLIDSEIVKPEFSTSAGDFDVQQLAPIADGLNWFAQAFGAHAGTQYHEGLVSPILLYPHHLDLSLVWFPHDDERQVSVGFSYGDESVPEPYVYMSAYPDVDESALEIPAPARSQTEGFKGVVLRYRDIQTQPELFAATAKSITKQYESLLN